MMEFVKFTEGNAKFYLGLFYLSPILLALKLKLISSHAAKERFIFYFFKNRNKKEIQELAEKFYFKLKQMALPKALERIEWHKQNKHKVVVVSASLETYLKKWCRLQKIELIGTQLEFEDQKLTGKFSTKNCNGIEKKNRIKEQYDLDKYQNIYVYGNSRGDKEMLSLGTQTFYKYFN
jgi:phosphatidylglycerophosphatase C